MWRGRPANPDLEGLDPHRTPVPAVHIGTMTISPLPRAIPVPAPGVTLEDEVERAVADTIAAAQGLAEPSWVSRSEDDGEVFRLEPDAHSACAYLGDAATDQLPEFIGVDLSGLVKGKSLHVSDLSLPAGIKAVKHGTLNPVVVAVTEPKVEEEIVAAPAAPADDKKGKKGKK